MTEATFIIGDTRKAVATIPDNSVDLILTSPPFLALRSYLPPDHPDKPYEIGSEATPADFIDVLLELTAEWDRVLAPHGSIAVELGDTYSGSTMSGRPQGDGISGNGGARWRDRLHNGETNTQRRHGHGWPLPKSLTMVPELYRIALAYGTNPLTGQESPAGRWRVRNVVRWVRPNPPVGALGDKYRPATSDLVIACRSRDRWFDLDAARTPFSPNTSQSAKPDTNGAQARASQGGRPRIGPQINTHAGAPPLDWWNIPPTGYPGAHYATYPPELCRIPIITMCPPKVCTTCGQPTRRITSAAEYVPSATYRGGSATAMTAGERMGDGVNQWDHNGQKNASVVRQVETIGWSDCGHNTWRPGHVLDPFGGSGTTGQVATGHARNATLIDLDPRNADLARERIGMFLTTTTLEELTQ